jgi:hypothetical protein
VEFLFVYTKSSCRDLVTSLNVSRRSRAPDVRLFLNYLATSFLSKLGGHSPSKPAIKNETEHTSQHLDANTIVLWRVSIPVNESLKENVELDLVDEGQMPAVHRLLKVFSDVPRRSTDASSQPPPIGECEYLFLFRTPHNFQQLPTRIWTPNHGQSSILFVCCSEKTMVTKPIGALKDVIKEKMTHTFQRVEPIPSISGEFPFPSTITSRGMSTISHIVVRARYLRSEYLVQTSNQHFLRRQSCSYAHLSTLVVCTPERQTLSMDQGGWDKTLVSPLLSCTERLIDIVV